MTASQAWLFLLLGYVATVSIEVPILVAGLSRKYSIQDRITTGLLLTAFTYPVVILVLPAVFTMLQFTSRFWFLSVAETYAALAEVMFFRFVTNQRLFAKPDRNALVIIVANAASYLIGEFYLSGQIMRAIQSLTVD